MFALRVSLLVLTVAAYAVLAGPIGHEGDLARVIGGHDAQMGEFPFQVSLQAGLLVTHFCGGVIIRKDWVLTAAHCAVALATSRPIKVKAGKRSLKKEEETEQSVLVRKRLVHEGYPSKGTPGAPYDIALLKLRAPLEMNDFVQPIRLPQQDVVYAGNATVSGWGAEVLTPWGMHFPDTLQAADLQTIDLDTCNMTFAYLSNDTPDNMYVYDTNVCTGPLSGGLSPCSGDSGGPLTILDENNDRVLIGLVSWGMRNCGGRNAPAVYTRVSAFVDWIDETIGKYEREHQRENQ